MARIQIETQDRDSRVLVEIPTRGSSGKHPIQLTIGEGQGSTRHTHVSISQAYHLAGSLMAIAEDVGGWQKALAEVDGN